MKHVRRPYMLAVVALFGIAPFAALPGPGRHLAERVWALIPGQLFVSGPPISIVSPESGAVFGAPADILVRTETDDAASFLQVDFYAGGRLIGSSRAKPYSIRWAADGTGSQQITAVGRTLKGENVTSAPVAITLREPSRQLLVQSTTLAYEGSFRFPTGTINGTRFGYGGHGLTYNAERNSLYVVGHDWHEKAAEVAIPEIRPVTDYASAPVATVLQPFYDPLDGATNVVSPKDLGGMNIGGLLVFGGKLYASTYIYYDASNVQRQSHFVSDLDLSRTQDAKGPFATDAPMIGYTSGYMGHIPKAWQASLGGPALTGNCCIPIISRTSNGPGVFSFDPRDVGSANPIPVHPLVYYPNATPLAPWSSTNQFFNGSTYIQGVVFPEGYRSVLFFGSHGTGTYCYGTGEQCNDTARVDKGNHAPPYIYRVWAYDALDLVAVRSGQKAPWSIKPYAMWELKFPIDHSGKIIEGAAYDPGTGRIFLTQNRGEQPLVHVFRLSNR